MWSKRTSIVSRVKRRLGLVEHGQGIDHTDDRTPLAYVYDGTRLEAILFDVDLVVEFRDDRRQTVVVTPDGQRKLEFWNLDDSGEEARA